MWNWIKEFIKKVFLDIWEALKKFGYRICVVVTGIVAVVVCLRNRREQDDGLGTGSGDDGREREIDKLDTRAQHTVDLEQGIIDECREELEATRECLESAQDSVGRLQDRSEYVESVIEEIKRRANKD